MKARALYRSLGRFASAAERFAFAVARCIREPLRRQKYAWMIRRSGLFDAGFYLAQCPDDAAAHRNPIRHFLVRGAAAGLDPNPLFDTSFYLERNPDVATNGKNPLVHFIRHGARERRSPGMQFDTAYYLARHRDVAASGMNPLAHYLAVGAVQGRQCRANDSELRPRSEDVVGRATRLVDERRARRILVVDHRIPTPDQDSGSVRMFAILKLLRQLGHEITFVSDTEEAVERYEREIERLGIAVLRGFACAMEHLDANGGEYGVVLLSRPETAERYLTAIRAHALRAKVVYDTVDLHWVRFARAAEVTGDGRARAEAERYRRIERHNTAHADLTLSVTAQERELLLREVPGARVEVLPNVHTCAHGVAPWEARRDLMFIGGFDHAPNVDAVEWFVGRILPLVHRRLPGVVLNVVGSKMPERVRALASATVRVAGHLRRVEPAFEAARVFVSPLRYGAGMKGKIGQSMGFGLPVVTTSIGAEGMMLVDGENALVADDPGAFADAVVRLYTSELLWSRISRSSVRHIEAHFSESVVLSRLAALFPPPPAQAADASGRARSGH